MGSGMLACVAALLLSASLASGAARPIAGAGHIRSLPLQQEAKLQQAEREEDARLQALPRKVMPTREPASQQELVDLPQEVRQSQQQQDMSITSSVVGGSWTYTATSVEQQTVGCALMSVIKRTMRQWVYAGEQLVGYRSYETHEMQSIEQPDSSSREDLPASWSSSSLSGSTYSSDGNSDSSVISVSSTSSGTATVSSSSNADAVTVITEHGMESAAPVTEGSTGDAAKGGMEVVMFESHDGGATGSQADFSEEAALQKGQRDEGWEGYEPSVVGDSYDDDSYFLALDELKMRAEDEDEDTVYDYGTVYSYDSRTSTEVEVPIRQEGSEVQVALNGLTSSQRVIVEALLAEVDERESDDLQKEEEEHRDNEKAKEEVKDGDADDSDEHEDDDADERDEHEDDDEHVHDGDDEDDAAEKVPAEEVSEGRKWFSLW